MLVGTSCIKFALGCYFFNFFFVAADIKVGARGFREFFNVHLVNH